MALSWWTYLSNHPATIGICTSKRGYTGTLIQDSNEFCLCIPNEQLKEAAFRCGTCSGRERSKSEEFGIALKDSVRVKTKHVAKSALVMECRLQNIIDVGDHNFYIAEVLECYADPTVHPLFALDGYRRLDTVATEK